MCYSYSDSSNILENLRIHKHAFQFSSAVVPQQLGSVLKTSVAWFLPPDILIELAGVWPAHWDFKSSPVLHFFIIYFFALKKPCLFT